MPRANNTPQGKLEQIPAEKVKVIVSDLISLHSLGPCKSDEEVEQRIDEYFDLCRRTSIRPGVESLSAALHIDRTCLWRWANGSGCSPRRTEAIRGAKSLINSFLEQVSLSGALNPVSSIFLLKNWANYRDTVEIEDNRGQLSARMTPDQIREQIEKDIPIDLDDVETAEIKDF